MILYSWYSHMIRPSWEEWMRKLYIWAILTGYIYRHEGCADRKYIIESEGCSIPCISPFDEREPLTYEVMHSQPWTRSPLNRIIISESKTIKKRIHFESTPRPCIHNCNISESILGQLHPWNYRWSPGDIPLKYQLKCFFDPVTLIFDLDLQTWPTYLFTWPTCRNPSSYFCPFGRESGNTQTESHTMSKLLHPPTCHRCGV